MLTITISTKNQVVIPKEARRKMKLTGGDSLMVEEVTEDRLVLKKVPSYYDLIGTIERLDEDPVLRVRKLRDNWRDNDLPRH